MENFMSNYLKQFGEVSFISANEIKDVVTNAQAGDKASLNKVVYSFQKFIIHTASKAGVIAYSYNSDLTADIISQGNIGLLKAIQNFDINSKAPFISYAQRCIIGSIYDFLNSNHQIHYSKEVIQNLNKIRKAAKGKTLDKNRAAEISAKTGLAEDCIVDLFDVNYQFTSLYHTNSSSGDEYNVCDANNIVSADDGESYLLNKEIRENVAKAIHTLNSREQFILTKYFGFNCEPMSYSSIGDVLGLSKARIGQLCLAAIKKLQNKSVYSYLDGLAA